MVEHTETFPNYQDIETPWAPEPIIWRYTTPGADYRSVKTHRERNFDALYAAGSDPTLTHIVREIEVMTHPYLLSMNRFVDDVAKSLVEVDDQFKQLEDLTALKVPDHEWHVFGDGAGKTRVLTRVEVVEGEDLLEPFAKEETADEATKDIIASIKEQVRHYRKHASGRPLLDIEFARQYRLGSPRSNLATRGLFLVDIEPVTHNAPDSVAFWHQR